MALNLPTYVPLAEAAVHYQVPAETLTRAIESGMIRAVQTPEGGILVADEDTAVIAAQAQAQSAGDELVSISEAGKKLNIPQSVIWRWHSYGWLPQISTGSRNAKLVSWQRARALANLYHEHTKRGSRLIPRDKESLEIIVAST